MPDMLVNLLKLAPLDAVLSELRQGGVIIRRAQPHEMTPVRDFVLKNFEAGWADEISVGYANKPGKRQAFAGYRPDVVIDTMHEIPHALSIEAQACAVQNLHT